MKRTFINFIMSTILASILGFVIILVISYLKKTSIISITFNDTLVLIFSMICFFFFGFFFGLKEKKKGLIKGLILMIIYFLIIYSIQFSIKSNLTWSQNLIYLSRGFLLLCGCFLGSRLFNKD